MNFYLFDNHNYYNRKIIRYNTINEYAENWGSPYGFSSTNFIVNDGIRTVLDVNYAKTSPYIDYATGNKAPSYLVVADAAYNIVSRWWVIESNLTCYGQARLSLLRDVIADNYDLVLRCPSFVEKGYINSVNDPAIFNDEAMSFNQIKTSESYIKDASRCPWYIGYLSKDLESKNISVPGVSLSGVPEYDSLEDYPYYQYNVSNPYIEDYDVFNFNFLCYNIHSVGTQPSIRFNSYQITWDQNGAREEALYIPFDIDGEEIYFGKTDNEPLGYTRRIGNDYFGIRIDQNYPWDNEIGDRIYDKVSQYRDWKNVTYGYTSVTGGSLASAILEQDDAIISIAGAPYKVTVTQDKVRRRETINNDTTLGQLMYSRIINPINTEFGGSFSTDDTMTKPIVSITYEATAYSVSLSPQKETTSTFTIPVNRTRTDGAAYDVIAVPAWDLYIDDKITSSSLSKKLVAAMISQIPSGTDAKLLYDFQLLPYCPLSDSRFSSVGSLGRLRLASIPNTEEETKYTIVGDDTVRTIILYLDNFEFRKTSYDAPITVPTSPLSFKVANQCDTYRLCSPNYNGQFEFSATKNGGVEYWNIACTYKPFNPYIKVAPQFGRLYGEDFQDSRGLVCGGDFSITQTSNAWENYELANKNYQNIFDRQIVNMEVNNSVQREKEMWNVAGGALTGVAGGAMTGAMVSGGSPYGAIIGGAAGGAASVLGGVLDIQLNERLRQEALNYTRDQFGYQLQNIQALPYSLTKVGPQTRDYKAFPFVEYYTCSQIEKDALLNKMYWNGMTVMRLSGVSDFLIKEPSSVSVQIGTFIKAKPVRLNNLGEDSHVAETIAAELNQGVYIL